MTLICWSLSAPINSHQDERYHIASIWCANKNEDLCKRLGTNKVGSDIAIIKANLCVPPNIEETYKRILIQQSKNGCRYEFADNDSLDYFSTMPNGYFEIDGSIGVWLAQGHTPSFYFKFMNFFVLENAAMSIVLMRIINALIFCILLTALLTIASKKVFTSTLFAISLTMIPHGLFLVSGINTSGWTYTGAALNWCFLYILLNSRFRFQIKTSIAFLGWLVTLSLIFTSRYDGYVYLIFSTLLLVGVKILGLKMYSWINLLIGSLSAVSLFLILFTQFSSILDSLRLGYPDSKPFLDLMIVFGNAVKVSVATPLRLLGLETLGWFPYTAPKVVLFAGLSLVILTSSQVFEQRNKPQKKFLLMCFCFYFMIILSQTYMRSDWTTPFYLIRTSWSGDQFHSRYFLPLFPFVIGMFAMFSERTQVLFDQSKFKNLITTLLTFSHTVVLYRISDIFRENPSWYWSNFPIGIETICVLGSLTFFSFIYLVFFTFKEANV